jgi:hypothetical protein
LNSFFRTVTLNSQPASEGTSSPSCNHLLSARLLTTYRARLLIRTPWATNLPPSAFFSPVRCPCTATKFPCSYRSFVNRHPRASTGTYPRVQVVNVGFHKIRRDAWRRWYRQNVTLKLLAYPLPHGFHRKLQPHLLDCCASLLTWYSSP